jgi:gluconokinase
MSNPLILVLDVGSSSTRAILFDSEGRSVPDAVAQIATNFTTASDGQSTIDADLLLSKVVDSIDLLLKNNPKLANQIAGVGCDSFAGNILGVDKDYKPITPIYTYADTRCTTDVAAIRQDLGISGVQAIHKRTATMLSTSYAPARLRWFARAESTKYKDVSHWITFGEYLFWNLFQKKGTSLSIASWNGLLNFQTLSWDKEWLNYLGLRESHLSPLTDIDEPVSGLKSTWADKWPALKSVPWFPVIGDGASANIGGGCDNSNRIALTLGTTGAMRVVVSPKDITKIPYGLWCYRVEKDRCLLGGATTEGGNLFAWMKRTLQLPDPKQLEEQVAALPPASHGLSILPFVAGERAPGWSENATANFQGITLSTTPVELLQAGLESVAYRMALIYRKIVGNLPSSESRQIVIGGGSIIDSPAWAQIFSDVLGEPLTTLTEKENTSRGTALLALEKLGIIKRTSDLQPETGRVFQPNLRNFVVHQTAIEKQVELYDRMVEKEFTL